eukprot:CAMPEP_0197521648 /NCGR_PEP_ID=MMETSP1318-20131121/6914_1 /TAXON_ID=552666 /ORGANISM="Partenskyella glossopodia, Strain RCC365" /LENGTH=177 /DNA_ID=CAMNT_0043073729 /DNA_START=490 /DNA_END=1020 /DNA_ORIENTATION=+
MKNCTTCIQANGCHFDINTAHADGRTVLMWAAMHGSSRVAETLIQAKADVNARCKNEGMTAMMISCSRSRRNPRIVKLLVKAKARVDMTTNNGETALFFAASVKGQSAVQIIKMLMAAKSSIDHRNSDGQTPLMHAAREGTHRVADLLLENGAVATSTDNQGFGVILHSVYGQLPWW